MLIQVKSLKLSSLKLSNIDFGCHSAMTQIASHRWIEASPRTRAREINYSPDKRAISLIKILKIITSYNDK